MMRLSLLVLAIVWGAGCASPPAPRTQEPAVAIPPDALVTQRGVLTVLGRQVTLNGYLASSATHGQRLVIMENFGAVLADVLVKPDGQTFVMKSSRALKPQWIKNQIAADVRCLFGTTGGADCPVQQLAPNHFLIRRRWYQLDLQIVNIQPGPQAPTMFDATKAEQP